MLVNAEPRLLLFQAIGLQFGEGCLNVINLKEATILSRVAAIFGKAYLYVVTAKDGRFMRRLVTGQHLKSHNGFVKRNGRLQVFDRQIHFVLLIRGSGFEYGFHMPS